MFRTLTENSELMARARRVLDGQWSAVIWTVFVYCLITVAIELIPKAGWLIFLIVAGPLSIGMSTYTLRLVRRSEASLATIFSGFDRFGLGVGTYLLMTLFIFLWSLLLIIPGVIAGLAYSQAFYLVADGSVTGAMEAIDKSKALMEGKKWKLFRLHLRFLGWGLLCLLTLGIGFLWFIPWALVSLAEFYEDVKPVPESVFPGADPNFNG